MIKFKDNSASPILIGHYWDQLWRQLHDSGKPALWDVKPSLAVAQDYSIFRNTFDPKLPILDIGCGSGIQSHFLAAHYKIVYGIDASKQAIVTAKKMNKQSGLSFLIVNLMDRDSVLAFHEKLGDSNIYIRGVLHQVPMEQRPVFVNHLKLLMGEKGSIYLIETAPNIQEYIQGLAEKFSALPTSLKRVLTSHFPPFGVSLDDIHQWFESDKYEILYSGHTGLHTNLFLEKGVKIILPAVFSLTRKVKPI